MEPRLNFVTLVVADLQRSRRFYLEGLGWPAALDVPGEVVMVNVGNKLVFSLWAESAARAEVGRGARGGTPGLLFQVKPFLPLPKAIDRVTTWTTGMLSPPSLKPLRSPLEDIVPSVNVPLWNDTH